MRKRDALRNMLVGWGLVLLSLVFTGGSLLYIQFLRSLPR